MTTLTTAGRSRPTIAWWVIAVLSFAIAGYGIAYLVLQDRLFPPPLADSFRARPWGIYPHALVGALGLILGPLQFHPRIQQRMWLHHRIGIAYIVIAMLVGIVGMYLAVYSYGGMITHVGFGALAGGLITATAIAYSHALAGRYHAHREWMIRSYALMFAAPTLRIWLPILIIGHGGDFDGAYLWVAWLCWIPNLIVAELYIRGTRKKPVRFGGIDLLPL